MRHHRLIRIRRRKLHTLTYAPTPHHQLRPLPPPPPERPLRPHTPPPPHHLDHLLLGSHKATPHIRQHIALKTQYRTRTYIYSPLAINYLSPHTPRFAAHQPARRIHAVTPNIQHRTPAQLGVHAEIVAPPKVKRKTERATQQPYLTQLARTHHLFQPHHPWMEGIHHRLHQQNLSPSATGNHLITLGSVASQRFLAQYMLARLRRAHRPYAVQVIG